MLEQALGGMFASFQLHDLAASSPSALKAFHGLIDREASRFLPRRKLLEGAQMLPHDRLRWNEYKGVLNEPFVIPACLVFGTLEGIGPQVEDLGRAQRD
jgi:hypothetical protein